MIALNETNDYAAEVAFTLPLDSDPLTGLTGWTFTLGEVQLKLPVGGWFNVPVVKIVEKGYGRFCVRLDSTQTTNQGDVYIKADIDGTQWYFGSDVIGVLGGDIPKDGAGSVSFYLPLATDPVNGAPLTGYDWTEGGTYTTTTPRVRYCLPDGAYQDADISMIEEIGFGGFKLNFTAAHTVKAGKVFVYAEVPGYQRFEGYGTILGAGVAEEPAPIPEPTPLPVPIVYGDPEYNNHYALALNRLPQQFRSGTLEYGLAASPGSSLEEILGVYIPPVINYEVVIPTVETPGVSNHLAAALNRLPQQFRSGELIYDMPADTTAEEIAGVYVPPVIEYSIPVPAVAPAVTNHVVAALDRLPQQFKSGELF